MAAPSVTRGYTNVQDCSSITPIAPTLQSAITCSILRNSFNGAQIARTSSSLAPGGRAGGRIVFTSSVDFSGGKYLAFQHGNEFANEYNLSSDVRVHFEDSSGNWVEIQVKDESVSSPGINLRANDFGQSYNRQDLGSSSALAFIRLLNYEDLTPLNSSGTLDWSDIVAVEAHYIKRDVTGTTGSAGVLGFFAAANQHILINGETSNKASFQDFQDDIRSSSSVEAWTEWYSPPSEFTALGGNVYVPWLDWGIGDGSTETIFEDQNAAISWFGEHVTTDYESWGPQLAGKIREVTINQSATDVVSWESIAIRNRKADWSFELKGSASGTFTTVDCIWDTFDVCTLRHGSYDTATFSNFEDAVIIDTNTTMTNCNIRGGGASCRGLVINSAAGDYSGLDVRFSNNANHDIELGSGGAGTYDLSGINVPSGYTLKIHNDSATNAVNVIIPLGLTVTTSTAGGGITIPDDSALVFSGVDSWTIYSTEADRDANTNAIATGTGNYSFNFSSTVTYYLRLVSSGETIFKSVTVTQAGETLVSLETASLLTAISAGLSFIPQVIYVDTTVSTNGTGSNNSPFDNLDDAVTLFNTGGYTFISLKSSIASPATPTTSLAGIKIQGVDKFSAIDINGQRLDGATIQNMLIYGTQSASDTTGVIIEDSRIIGDYTNLKGVVKESEVLNPTGGAVTISVHTQATFLDSSIVNALDVTFDLTSSVFFGMRACDGPLRVSNMTTGSASFEMNSGEIEFLASCTGGSARINDTLDLINNSAGTTIDTQGLIIKENGVDANIQYVNDIQITGTGQSGNEWGPV